MRSPNQPEVASALAYTRKTPRITMLGEDGMEEIPYDQFPDAQSAVELEDYFKAVRIKPSVIDYISTLVPQEQFVKEGGVHRWISNRANFVFSKLDGSNQKEGKYRQLKYIFEFDSDGPVLSKVIHSLA